MKTLFVGLGKVVLFLALTALITTASLFVLGGFLTSWPLLRLSPRGRRKAIIAQIVGALLVLAGTFAPDDDSPALSTDPVENP